MSQAGEWRKYFEPLVGVAIVFSTIFLLIWGPFLFGVIATDETILTAFYAAEATNLGFFGLLVVYLLGVSAQRGGRRLGSSSNFVAGFHVVLLGFGIIWGIRVLVSSFFVIDPPYDVIAELLSVFSRIISPIIVGRVWKSKRDAYWTGVLLGFAFLFIVWFLIALEIGGGGGTYPV